MAGHLHPGELSLRDLLKRLQLLLVNTLHCLAVRFRYGRLRFGHNERARGACTRTRLRGEDATYFPLVQDLREVQIDIRDQRRKVTRCLEYRFRRLASVVSDEGSHAP